MRAVLKIGGGILRNNEDLGTLAKILGMNSRRENVLVVSALKGVTDALLNAYENGKDITAELGKTHDAYFKTDALEPDFKELSGLLSQTEKTIARKEKVASFGERLSSRLVSAYLDANGIPSISMNAEECGIVSDGRFEKANCLLEKTKENFRKNVIPKIKGKTIVITGYYGVDGKGNATTFGRGGSDYSAAVVAVACEAGVLEIWKDVEGFLSADPRVVPEAKKLDEISFEEAKELGYLGAKILHPRTMDPLKGTRIFAEIRSVLAPEKTGTRIAEERKTVNEKIISSIAMKKGMAIVNIKGSAMVDIPGVAAEVFETVAKKGVSIDTIATSQVNISFTVEEKDIGRIADAIAEVPAKLLGDFEIRSGFATVGVVGEGMKNSVGTAARIFGAVAEKGINVEIISESATEINITFIVRQEHAETCVRAVHDEFKLGE